MASISLKYKSKQGNLTAPGDVDPGAMIPIATTTVGSGGSGAITFSNIPQNYEHLQVRIIARSTNTSYSEAYIYPYINGVTGSNYTQHGIYVDGGTVSAAGSINDAAVIQRFAASATTSGIFGVAIVDFLDYSNANKKPVMRSLGGVDRNGAGVLGFYSTMIQTAGPITQLDFNIFPTSFAQYSSIALYGIKRAGA